MPLWAVFTILAVQPLVSVALWAAMVRLVGRLWSVRVPWRKAFVLGLMIVLIPVATFVITMLFDLSRPLTLLAGGLGMFTALVVLPPVFLKRAGGRGWGRTIGASLSLLVVMTAVGIPLGIIISRWIAAYWVSSIAMLPTLKPGDHMLVDGTLRPRRWDIVVFHPADDPRVVYPFRVVGLPGETVEIVEEGIKINGAIVQKPAGLEWLHHNGMLRGAHGGLCYGGTGAPITLAEGELFVLGDNTDHARDSRLYDTPARAGGQPGAVAESSVVGVVRLIYRPLGDARVFR